MRVVSTNSNMIDVVLFRQVFEGSDKGSTIVGDDFVKGAPATDDVFEDPIAKGDRSFTSKFSPFGVGRERTSTLDYVLETTRQWHVHRVDVDFAE